MTTEETPDGPHPELGKEIPLTLVKVTKIRRGQEIVNKLTGEVQIWEERQEYIPREESHDDSGVA